MSTDLENVLVVQKLMDLEKVTNPANTVLVGPVQKTLNKFTASAVSNNQIIFNNIVAPSLSTVMKRVIRIEMEALVIINCNAAAMVAGDPQFNAIGANGKPVDFAATQTAANICPRAFPLSGVCSSVDIRLNGGSTNCALASYSQIYPFLQSEDDIKRYGSECPTQPDNSATYENASTRSPFLGLNANSNVPSRGSYLVQQTAAGTTGPGGVWQTFNTVRWTEELNVSPFLTGHNMDDVGLVNVNNLTITLRLGDLTGMFSAMATNAGSIKVDLVTVGAQSVAQPTLLVEFDSQNSIMSQRSPQNAVYSYNQIQTYQQVICLAASNKALTALRLPCQPSKIYVFIAPTNRTTAIPDHFLRITSVAVNFNEKNSLLAGMNESSLYTMSAFNAGSGFMNWNQWRYGAGSLLIIDVQRDLSVAEGSQSGSQNQFSTLQITVTYDNTNCLYATQALDAAFYNAFQVVVSPGKAYVSASQCEFVVQGPSPAVVLGLIADDDSTKIPEDNVPASDNADGKGFSDLIQKGLKLAYEHRGAIMSAAAPHVKKLIGGSMGGQVDGGWVSAGGLKHRRS